MDEAPRWLELLSYAALGDTRRRIRDSHVRGLAILIAIAFLFVSMLIGQMLVLEPVQGSYEVLVLWHGANGAQWWNYPGLLAVQPWGILSLPFFPTLAMIIVSIGVGIGGAVGVLLIVPLFRRSIGTAPRDAATGAAAGVGPAITGLATLGACCCTSCVGAAGISVVAAASGTSLNNLLLNNWYIGVFQIGVVYVSLLAQERIFRQTREYCPVPPPMDRKFAAGAALRIALLVAGITWSLAMLVEWGETPPLTASAATWYHWVFEHQLLAVTAIVAGLFPKEFANGFRALATRFAGSAGRLALLIAGVTWGIGVPAALVHVGLGGFLNEVFGSLGLPVSWGAEVPDASLGAPLYFHWAFQHLLLGAFAIALALAPIAATRPLLWTVAPDDRVAPAAEEEFRAPPEISRPTAAPTSAPSDAPPSG